MRNDFSVLLRWNRGMILDKYAAGDQVLFDVFFADIGGMRKGMSMKDMFPLKTDFVSKLPFQSIQIKCGHIAPLDTDFDTTQTWSLDFNPSVDDLVDPYFISEDESKQLDISVRFLNVYFIFLIFLHLVSCWTTLILI